MPRASLIISIAVAALTAMSCGAAVLADPAVSSFRLHPENPHYFQEPGGKPYMVSSVTAIVPSSTQYDYIAGINEILSRHLTYARVWHFLSRDVGDYTVIWPWAFSSVPGSCWGGNKIDMNVWNADYWSRMTDSMARANAGGLYAEIMIFDRCGMSPAPRFCGSPWCSENNINNLETPDGDASGTPDFYYYATKPNLRNQQERYVRRLIDQTIAYPNVFYEIENEHWTYNDPTWVRHYSQFVKDYIAANYPNSPKLVSYSSLQDDLEDCYTNPNVDVVNAHFGAALDDDPSLANAYIEPRWIYNKAINIDEFGNHVHTKDISVLRNECWTIITSGGNFHIEDAPGDWARDICENIRSFKALSGWDFIHAAPNKALITSGGGYCLAQPGVEYVCYFPTGGSKTITLSAGTYRAEWWNPRTAGFYNTATFSFSGGSKTLSSPDSSDWVLRLTTQAALTTVLQSKPAGAITIDGNSNDWNLGELTTKTCAGDAGTGDIGIVGYDANGVCYAGGHWTGGQFAPANAADHAAKIYSRHDASYLYFLVRCSDSDIRTSNPVGSNSSNDCVEFHIDPSHNGGAIPISGSTSDARLVIDAANQKNVYLTTPAYASQILGGVTSAVSRDSSGWWMEARIAKNVFSAAIPATGTIGMDFTFRDNDSNNTASLTTVYTWRDPEVSTSIPTNIPDRWGDLRLMGPPDTTPPGPVTSFAATAGTEQVALSWHNPSDADFTGTMIRYKITGHPTSPTDGTLVIDKSGAPSGSDSYVHPGRVGGTTCYYSAFAHDDTPNYATKADASATPAASAICFSDGFSYPDGALGGVGGWSGACSSIVIVGGTVKITGGSPQCQTSRAVACSGSGGMINVRVQVKGGTGNQTMWSLYIDDPSGANLARWYGNAGSARPRIDGSNDLVLNPATLTGGWDTLDVNINTITKIDEFFFNGTSLGTLNYSSMGGGSTVGSLRFERIDNSGANGNTIYFDNLTVGNADTTPPGPVSNFTAAAEDGQIRLAWTNPTAPDFTGVKILYKTTGYPASRTDGTAVYNGTGTTFVHTGLANGARCYYSAFAHDGFPNYSTAANASAAPAADASIPVAKGLADGQQRVLRGNLVSAVFPDCFYIEDPVACSGLKVIGGTAAPGRQVDVAGVMRGQGAERYIDCTGNFIVVIDMDPIAVAPLGIGLRAVGGTGLNPYAPGVLDGVGLNNLGLLVTVWGKVTQRDRLLQYFYIDDGSGITDGTQTEVSAGVFEPSIGVRVKADPTAYAKGSYVIVTGIGSAFTDSGVLKRQVLPIAGGARNVGPQ